ncbi:MAG: hypothetical protein ACFFCM_02405 [Promethearchaeota archaeon]
MNKPYFLYIINSAGICLFSYNFKRRIEPFEGPLFSGFITAVSRFSEELNKQLTYTETQDRIPFIPINKSFEIMIAYKESLIGALIVEKKDIDEDMKIFLDDILDEFLIKYTDILLNWDDNIVYFENFSDEIERIFTKVTIFSFQIPKIKNGTNKNFKEFEHYTSLLELIDGKKDINDISQLTSKTFSEVKNIISNLLWKEIIELSEKVYDDDIFEPKRDLFYLIRSENLNSNFKNSGNGISKQTEFELLKAIDGFKTVYDLSEEFQNLSLHDIKHIISFYLTIGNYLEKVELYPQIININDEIRDKLPPESLALSYHLENICDGELCLAEISKKIDVSVGETKRTLDVLKNHVTYKKKYKK